MPVLHVLFFIIASFFGFVLGAEYGISSLGSLAIDKNTVGVVEFVYDGDTIKLVDERTIRYLGIDTPERDEKYADQAREKNILFVDGKEIKLEYDFQTVDQYGRDLAFVWVEPDEGIVTLSKLDKKGRVNISVELVRQGWADTFLFDGVKDLKYKQELLEAKNLAKEEGLGMWE